MLTFEQGVSQKLATLGRNGISWRLYSDWQQVEAEVSRTQAELEQYSKDTEKCWDFFLNYRCISLLWASIGSYGTSLLPEV